jgi:hypothetical protein
VTTSSTIEVLNGFLETQVPGDTLISFKIAGIRNPKSLQTSDSFTIKALTAEGYGIDT